MKKYARILLCGFALSCNALPALANFDISQGTGTHIFSIDGATTPAGSGNCTGSNIECTASIPIDKSGTPLFATGNPGLVTGTGGTFPVTGTFFQATQPISAVSLPLPAGAATQTTSAAILTALGTPFQAGGNIGNTTFAVTESGTWNINAITGTQVLPTGASTAALQTTGNTTLSSILSALGTPFQAGGVIGNTSFIATQPTGSNLHMVCDSGCSGSGGTSSAFGSAFPSAGTAIGLTNGTSMVAWSATSNYGTAPSAIAVPAVNASVTASALPAGAATSAGQAGVSTAANQATEIASLATIATNSGLPIPAGTASIGAVTNLTLGGLTDAPCTFPLTTGSWSVESLLRCMANAINSPPPLGTTNGWTPFQVTSLTGTAQNIKTTAGQLGRLQCDNPNGSEIYVRVFNNTAATVNGAGVGSSTSVNSLPVPAGTVDGFTLALVGDQYATAISVAAVTTSTGGTAPSTAVTCTGSVN